MERAVEVFAAVLFFVIGVSHLARPQAWVEFFVCLRGKGEVGSLVDGFLYLPIGALVVGFHNVWGGLPTVLTVAGWAFLVKSLIRFVWPSVGLRILSRVSAERAWEFRAAGVFALALSGVIALPVVLG